jgi:hypothetical protein
MTGSLIARGSVLNDFFGQLVPLTVGVFAIPVLVKRLGVDGFGTLSLTWMLFGYHTLFDLGLALGTTKLMAEDVRDDVLARQRAPYILRARKLVRRAIGCSGTILEILLEFIRREFVASTSWRCGRCKSGLTSCSDCPPYPSGKRQLLGERARQLVCIATVTT